jgi:hypothetical protein
MRLASLVLSSLFVTACGPDESVPDVLPATTAIPLQAGPPEAPSAITLTRTYDCFQMVNTDTTSFGIEHIVNVMSDGSVISTCGLSGALQGSGTSVFQSHEPEAETGQCIVAAYANGTPTGESWTLKLLSTRTYSPTYSRGTYHRQNSPQEGLVYSLACSVR